MRAHAARPAHVQDRDDRHGHRRLVHRVHPGACLRAASRDHYTYRCRRDGIVHHLRHHRNRNPGQRPGLARQRDLGAGRPPVLRCGRSWPFPVRFRSRALQRRLAVRCRRPVPCLHRGDHAELVRKLMRTPPDGQRSAIANAACLWSQGWWGTSSVIPYSVRSRWPVVSLYVQGRAVRGGSSSTGV